MRSKIFNLTLLSFTAALGLEIGQALSPTITFAKAEESLGENYFIDGDMEDLSCWNFSSLTGHYEQQNVISCSGNALKLYANANCYAQRDALILPNQTIFAFEYYIKVTEASSDFSFSTFATGGSIGWIDYSSQIVKGITDGWLHVTSLLTINGEVGGHSSIFFGFKYYSGYGTVYLDDISLKSIINGDDANNNNYDFELSYQGLAINWTYSGDGEMTVGNYNCPNTKGEKGAKLTNIAADVSYASGHSFDVIPDHTYEVSYMAKLDGDFSADSYVQFLQYDSEGNAAYSTTFDATRPNDYYRSKGKPGNDEFLSPAWQYHLYGESAWRRVSFSFTVSTEASYIIPRVIVLGRKASLYIDDLVIKEISTKDNSLLNTKNNYDENSDFENIEEDGKPVNWYMSSSRSYKSLLTTDSSFYYSGKRSLHLESEGTIEKTLVENAAKIEVEAGNIYEFSAKFASMNCDPTVKIKLNLYYFDSNGNPLFNEYGDRLYVYGETMVTSCSENKTGWSTLYTRSAIPSIAKYISYYFEISNGHAEIWLDDVVLKKVESADGGEKLEYHTDFDKVDSDGLIDGWSLYDDTYSSFYIGEDGAELFVNYGEGKITHRINSFITDYQYHLLFNYNSSSNGYIRIDFFNIHNVLIEGASQERTFSQDSEPINFYFDAPSNTYAIISIGLNSPGILHLNYLYTYQSRLPSSRSEWDGNWIWYNEDSTKNVESYRYFRYTFDLEDYATYAPLQLTVDDKYVLYVNGIFIDFNWDAGADSWANVHTYYLQDYLVPGRNVIALKAFNLVSEAAVLFDGKFTLANGSQFNCLSSRYVRTTKPSDTLGDVEIGSTVVPIWAMPQFDDSSWELSAELGIPPTSPWGPVYYDSSLYVSNEIEIINVSVQRKIEVGQTLVFNMTLSTPKEIESNFSLTVGLVPTGTDSEEKSVQKTNLSVTSENADMTKWVPGEKYTITCQLRISSLLDAGRYDIRLESNLVTISNDYLDGDRIIDNRFASIKVLESSEESQELISTVENYNGAPTLMLNGQPYSPALYLRPDLDVYRQTDAEDRIANSTYELYITYQGCLGKSGQDILYQPDGSLDYEAFDSAIISLLNASIDGYVMVNFGLFAPSWWMNAHPSEVSYAMDKNGNKIKGEGVSFSSELWLETSNELLGKLIEHMKTQKYYNRVFGLRITAGQTYEFMNYGATGFQLPDYSDCALIGFRNWLRDKYGSVDALRESWHNSDVTFDNVSIPTFVQRGETGYQTLLDTNTDMFIYDYNTYLSSKSADCLLTWAETCKTLTENKKIVGAYYGYMWTFGSYDGTCSSHAALARVLGSDYIDFIASPINYNERILGMSTTFMSFADTVQAYGKLYLLEQDNRTYMSSSFSGSSWDGSWDYQVGGTHTASDTIYQLKRDFCANFVNGTGYWNYDMYGGWLDDEQIYEYMKTTKNIYDYSLSLEERSFTSDVAIFMCDNTYNYFSVDDEYNSTYILSSTLLMDQRMNLNRMGTSYDTYTLSALRAGLVSPHKVNIFIATFEVDAETQNAIHEYLKQTGGTAVWIYACGLSNGTGNVDSEANMSALTGFDLAMNSIKTSSLQVETLRESNNSLLNGLSSKRYGTNSQFISPQIYINEEDDSEILGHFTDGGKAALGVKQLDGYKSIFSGGPNLPVKLLRNILIDANVHIYSENSNDIIYANKNYVALHSMVGETKFIQLDGMYAVYDEFAKEYISYETNVIIYNHEAGDTKLFRLDPVGGRNEPNPEKPEEKPRYNKTEFVLTTIVLILSIAGICALDIGIKHWRKH